MHAMLPVLVRMEIKQWILRRKALCYHHRSFLPLQVDTYFPARLCRTSDTLCSQGVPMPDSRGEQHCMPGFVVKLNGRSL
jgi:hypothetical protein